MQKYDVSLVVISKNEETNIERCLSSVSWVSEKIVLDSCSTDKTVEIAKALGAKVFVEEFRGFRDQKNRAVELATCQWILSLDADEVLSPELSNELESLVKAGTLENFDACEMPRLSFHMGRWIRRGGWYPDWQVRLFHRNRAKWVGGEVHERVEAPRKIRSKNALQHFVFKDLSHQIHTNNFYSSCGARELLQRGKSFSLFKLLTKPISKFVETYVWKRGFLDGMPGFIISVGAAYSVFLKFAKVWEAKNVDSKKELGGKNG